MQSTEDRDGAHADEGAQPDGMDAVWRALANPMRRHMLDLLSGEPLTTGDLAERFDDLSRFAVMQHLKVLEEADLVIPVREGRKRYNYMNPVPIQQVYDRWVHRYMQPWTDALTSLKRELEERERERA